MTMIEEVMPDSASGPEPLGPRAEAAPRDLDALFAAEQDLAAPAEPPALPEVEEKEPSCETASGTSSRASSVQKLGSAPAEDRVVTLELRLRWNDLPEALREALQQAGDTTHSLPVELRLQSPE